MKEKDYIVWFRRGVLVSAKTKPSAIARARRQIGGSISVKETEVIVEREDEGKTCPDCGRSIGENEERCGRCSIGQNYA